MFTLIELPYTMEARSCSMDLTLSKSLTLGKAQVNLALLSLNRDF